MYRLTVESDDGIVHIWDDVLDYNFIDVDLCQDIANDNETELSEDEIKEVEERCENYEQMPNMEDLRWLIRDIINERG